MTKVTVVGLGPGALDDLTLGAMRALEGGRPVLLRTARHPVVASLQEMGIAFDTCDDLYEREPTFAAVYGAIVERIFERAQGEGLVYAVPGHPMVGEETVRRLLQGAPERGVTVEVVPAPSFLDSLFTALRLDPVGGLQVLDAYTLDEHLPNPQLPAVVMQVHSATVASDAKIALMEFYPDDHPVALVRAAGVPGQERVAHLPLYEVDRQPWLDDLTSLYVAPLPAPAAGEADPNRWAPARWPLDPLVEVMAALRGPDGCPWDREQTHQSLKRYMLEEAYEAVEAVDSGDPDLLQEELGDVLLQVVFHAQIASEADAFTMHDVVRTITEKLVRRHPHVFGDVSAPTAADVTRNWEAIKRQEKGESVTESLLDGVSAAMPALSRAFQVQRKAAQVGFDWDDEQGPAAKVREELDEVLAASPEDKEQEMGDLLFACVNLARVFKIDPETALTSSIRKFTTRFRFIEREVAVSGKKLSEMTLAEMDEIWNRAKKVESTQKTAKK